MAKIGRNEPCLCGSGKKFKKCCGLSSVARFAPSTSAAGRDLGEKKTVTAEVKKIVQAGLGRKALVCTSGVLVLFATVTGDAWVLEVTAGDALQLTDQGKELAILIEENPDTTLIEWSHKFAVKKGGFVVTSYKDKREFVYDGYPVAKILAAMKGISKRVPASMAGKINVPVAEGSSAGSA